MHWDDDLIIISLLQVVNNFSGQYMFIKANLINKLRTTTDDDANQLSLCETAIYRLMATLQSAQIFRSSLHMSATGQDLEVFQKLTELNHRWSYLSLASVGKVINSSKKKKCLTVKSELETLVQLTRGMNIAGSNDDESDENKRLSRSDK